MNIIEKIITNYYYCCHLPVIAVDSKLKEINSIGYTDNYFAILNKLNVLKDLENKSSNNNDNNKAHHGDGDIINTENASIILNYENDINYIVTAISRFDKDKGYFIIGPIRSSEKHNLDNILRIEYRPSECFNFLSSMMISISDSTFSNSMSDLSFNSHVRKAIMYLHENYANEVNIDELCTFLSINKSYFCKIFKSETKLTFSNFLNKYRVEKSKHLLLHTDLSILDVAISVGFNSQNYYSMIFKKYMNKSPLEYRNN